MRRVCSIPFALPSHPTMRIVTDSGMGIKSESGSKRKTRDRVRNPKPGVEITCGKSESRAGSGSKSGTAPGLKLKSETRLDDGARKRSASKLDWHVLSNYVVLVAVAAFWIPFTNKVLVEANKTKHESVVCFITVSRVYLSTSSSDPGYSLKPEDLSRQFGRAQT
ncbi:hypothetical protein EVAR_81803_1 [Eumeta japonica]|uniref:Uncharacterized protein n=1 Tax=Eumeta variegata TaxID=151549 RepID=A0A4C1UHM2_EUMVA|nr:hypothetical protein EVAR_81803_1 [Eumeta japonica]